MKALRFARHPLHPLLVHFPVALWTLAVIADGGGLLAGDAWWWRVGFGCQALGALAGMPAMVAGFMDYAALGRGHPAQATAEAHAVCMCTASLSFLTSLAMRDWSIDAIPPPAAIIATGCGFVAMIAGGWLGGKLVYRFAVGVEQH